MLELPTSLSPSRVEKFLSCPLAFRFATVEKLPERANIHTTRGSLVHRALELAYARPAAERTPDAFRAALAVATHEFRALPDVVDLGLSPSSWRRWRTSARSSSSATCAWRIRRPCGRSASSCGWPQPAGALELRGVIDRLDLTDDGELVVVDYKTGRPPSPSWEQRSLSGVQFYAFLCEQVLGRRPAAVRLMYLSTRRGHRGAAVGPVDALRHDAGDGDLERRRGRRAHRRLPAPPELDVRRVQLPGVVPGVRRRPRPCRRGAGGDGRRTGARGDGPDVTADADAAAADDAARRSRRRSSPRPAARRSARRSPASTAGPTSPSSASAATPSPTP